MSEVFATWGSDHTDKLALTCEGNVRVTRTNEIQRQSLPANYVNKEVTSEFHRHSWAYLGNRYYDHKIFTVS